MGYRGVGPIDYPRSDERIREDLKEHLPDAGDVDARGILITVSNGIVTLGGTVEQRWMKHRAEDLADRCSGVRDVSNEIRVMSQFNDQHSHDQGSSAKSPRDGGPAADSSDAGLSWGNPSEPTGDSSSDG